MQNKYYKIYKSLEKAKIDSFLVTDLLNIKYLTGFNGSHAFLLLTDSKKIFFTDSRYYEFASKQVKHAEVHLIQKNLSDILKKYHIKKLGFESNSVTYNTYIEWKTKLANIKLIPTKNIIERIRQIKDDNEIKLINNSVRITEKILEKVKIKQGISELKLAQNIEKLAENISGTIMSFSTVVAFGRNASMPHAVPTNKKLINNEIVLIDCGIRKNEYSSDLTRTFWIGKITQKFNKIYNIVLDAQKLAIEAIRPGVHINEIDALARNYINKHGFGRNFGHSIGHGIGMAVHELPAVNSKNCELLEEGMVLTIEPGIYIPGWGGVRIEDMVLVTKNGYKVLTKSPKQLEKIVISNKD